MPPPYEAPASRTDGGQPAAGTSSPASLPRLEVQVFVIEETGAKPLPAPGAMVHLLGEEDSFPTNDKGIVKLSATTERVTLTVMLAGTPICAVDDLPVPPERIVKVVVDKSRSGQCEVLKPGAADAD